MNTSPSECITGETKKCLHTKLAGKAVKTSSMSYLVKVHVGRLLKAVLMNRNCTIDMNVDATRPKKNYLCDRDTVKFAMAIVQYFNGVNLIKSRYKTDITEICTEILILKSWRQTEVVLLC